MAVIAVSGLKGGAGKSTTAIALAAEWTARGLRVLLVDADPQQTARTWGEVAIEQQRACPTVVSMGAAMWQPDQLPRLAASFERVLIDLPPRLGEVQRAALLIADLALIPSGPSSHDAWALAPTLDLLREARGLRPDLRAALLITRKVAGTIIGRAVREVLADTGLPVLDSELGYRVDYQEASAAGQGASTYAPSSVAADEVRALVDELDTMLRVVRPIARARAKRRQVQREPPVRPATARRGATKRAESGTRAKPRSRSPA